MLSRLRALFHRRPSPSPTIVQTAAGFELRDAGAVIVVPWAEVRRVVAYKRDLYTADCIVLAVEYGVPLGVVELPESWPGFSELFGAMEAALGVSPSWYLEIMTPAFAPSPRILYARADGADQPRPAAD
jgi:hypothetical protein